jgi:hypothetical protein
VSALSLDGVLRLLRSPSEQVRELRDVLLRLSGSAESTQARPSSNLCSAHAGKSGSLLT